MQVAGINIVKELVGMAGMLRNPHAIQNIYRIEDGMLGAPISRQMIEHLRQDDDVRRVIQERYLRGKTPNLPELRSLPGGTLGREYARLIDTYGFNPGYYQSLNIVDDLTYALARVRETHDLWHVVLGFHPTPIGEIGLKAFELAQLHRPMAAVIVAGGIFRHLAIGHEQFADLLASIAGGYELGRRAKPFLAEKWEEHWDEPVESLRARLEVGSLSPAALGAFDPRGVKPSRAEEWDELTSTVAGLQAA